MKPKLLIVIITATILGTILSIVALKTRNQAHSATRSATQVFQVNGQIREMDVPNKTIRIAHEEIPGYMPAMTMPLQVKNAKLLKGLAPGDEVHFELAVSDDASW